MDDRLTIEHMERDREAVAWLIREGVDPRYYIGLYYIKFRQGSGWRLPNKNDYVGDATELASPPERVKRMNCKEQRLR